MVELGSVRVSLCLCCFWVISYEQTTQTVHSESGYARGVRERDSGDHGSELKNESAWDARNAFSHNLRALSHDRAMLVLGESWTNGTATCVGLSTIFLDRRSATGELPAMSEW